MKGYKIMEFEVIDFSNKNKWHEIVKEKEIYYQWEYIDALYQNNEGEPFLAYAKCNNNYVFNVYLKRDINDVDIFKNEIERNKYFDIIIPYGYGGVDIIGDKNQELLDFYFEKFMKYCEENNIISEFVRLNPLSDNYRFY